MAEVLVEGLSRVKRCTNEGRALMSLDLQVLINGLRHLAPHRLASNLHIVEAYIKVLSAFHVRMQVRSLNVFGI